MIASKNKYCTSVRRLAALPLYLLILCFLLLIPTGFEKKIYFNAEGSMAKVLEVDNSTIFNTGIFKQGEQRLRVKLLSGSNKNLEIDAVNLLNGSLESDKIFSQGDTAWVLVERDKDDNPISVIAVDRWRCSRELICLAIFIIALALFVGSGCISILLSFTMAFLFSWKVLVPLTLKGYNPMLLSSLVLTALTLITIPLVSGFNKRSLGAILGALASNIVVGLLAILASSYLMLDGYTLNGSESLLYSGFLNLDIYSIFTGVILLSSGGAVMDLSVDVAASMKEVYEHTPTIDKRELFYSGLRVGRAGLGTQVTTLLLAYMSSYLTVFMVYMAQGTPVINILTSKMIASEIAQTLVGCMGLIFVTPLTAIFCVICFYKNNS